MERQIECDTLLWTFRPWRHLPSNRAIEHIAILSLWWRRLRAHAIRDNHCILTAACHLVNTLHLGDMKQIARLRHQAKFKGIKEGKICLLYTRFRRDLRRLMQCKMKKVLMYIVCFSFHYNPQFNYMHQTALQTLRRLLWMINHNIYTYSSLVPSLIIIRSSEVCHFPLLSGIVSWWVALLIILQIFITLTSILMLTQHRR